jgi:hypothetical protein
MTSNHRLGHVGLVMGLVLSAGLLSACSKPQPTISLLSGSTSTIVRAQPFCVLFKSPCAADLGRVAQVRASAGSRILVDVPAEVAHTGWVAAAFTTDAAGQNTPIPGAGSAPLSGTHSVRLTVPTPAGDTRTGSYQLQVSSLKPNNQRTTWLVTVALSS